MANDVHITSTDKVECECCDYVYDADKYKASELPNVGRNIQLGPCKSFGGIVMCPNCLEGEIKAHAALKESEKDRVEQVKSNLLKEDATIAVQQDIFNAKIKSINDIKLAIDADTSIENKQFVLAQTLEQRFVHLNSVISGAQDTIKESQSEQRAIQTYYNELAKKLRADEREQIKLKDVQYRPPEKPTKAVKAPTVKKYDKNEIRKAASDSGIPEAAIQMIVVQRQISVIDAVRVLQELGMGKK